MTAMMAPRIPPTEVTDLTAAPVNAAVLLLGVTAPVPEGEDAGAAAAADDEVG